MFLTSFSIHVWLSSSAVTKMDLIGELAPPNAYRKEPIASCTMVLNGNKHSLAFYFAIDVFAVHLNQKLFFFLTKQFDCISQDKRWHLINRKNIHTVAEEKLHVFKIRSPNSVVLSIQDCQYLSMWGFLSTLDELVYRMNVSNNFPKNAVLQGALSSVRSFPNEAKCSISATENILDRADKNKWKQRDTTYTKNLIK